jgi:hypothetical protein
MAFEQRDMSGVLFRNEDKEEGDKRPNATGNCMIDGVEYYVSAWTKEGKSGKFQSLAFKRKEQQRGPQRQTVDDDDTPF